jgi:hypothetical protein
MPATAHLAAITMALATFAQLQAFVPASSRTLKPKTTLQNLYLGEEGSVAPPRVTLQMPETTTPQSLDSWQMTTTKMEDAMAKNLSKLIADIESEAAKASSIKVEYAKYNAEEDKDSHSLLNRMQFQAISEDLDAVLNDIKSDMDTVGEELDYTDTKASPSTLESDEELVVAESQGDAETMTSSFTFESNEELGDEESQGDTEMTASSFTFESNDELLLGVQESQGDADTTAPSGLDSVESDEELLVVDARTDSPEYDDDNDGDSDDDGEDDDEVSITSTDNEECSEAPRVMADTGRPTIVPERPSQKSSKPKMKHPLVSVLGEPSDGQTKEADEWITRFFKDGNEFDASAKQEPTRTKEVTPEVEPETSVSPWETLLENDFTSRLIDAFTPEENIRTLKEQQDVDIVKVAVSHFSKALVGGGKAAFSAIGAMLKATKSPEVVDSVKEASSTVSATTKFISEALAAEKNKAANDSKSIADISKEVGVAAASIGNVASAFLKSFGCTQESSDALEAATETAKECSSLLASLAALGIKQGDRIQEYVVSMENNLDGSAAVSTKSLDDIVSSVKDFGTKQSERLKDSFASIEDMISTSTKVSQEGKAQENIDDNVVAGTKPFVSPTKMSFEDFQASVAGFGMKQRELAQAQIDLLKSKMKTAPTKKATDLKQDASTDDTGFGSSSFKTAFSSIDEKPPTDDFLASTTKEYGLKIDALKEKMNSFTATIPNGSGDGATSLPIDTAPKGPTSVDNIVNLAKERISHATDTFQSNVNAFMSIATVEPASTTFLPQPLGVKPIEDAMKKAKSIGDVGSVFLQRFGRKLESGESSFVAPELPSNEYISRSTFAIARPQASFTALGAKVMPASSGKKGYPGGDYDDDKEVNSMSWPQAGLSSMVAFGIQQGERVQQHLAKMSRLFTRRNVNDEEQQASPRLETMLRVDQKVKNEDSESSRLGVDEAWEAAALELREELNLGELLAGIEIDGKPLEIPSLYTQAKGAKKAEVETNTKEVESSDTNKGREESPFFFATL